MSTNTPALHAEYRKVIPARWEARKDGTPLHCLACGQDIKVGRDYAATNDFRDWHNYCADCAASFPGQIKGLYGRCHQLVTPMQEAGHVPEEVAQAMGAVADPIRALIADDTNVKLFLTAKVALMDARRAIGQARKVEREAEMRAKLAGDPIYEGLMLATMYCQGKFHDVAENMLAQWVSKGSLSPAQVRYAEAIIERAEKLASKHANAQDEGIEIPKGMYVTRDGQVWRIYAGNRGRLCARLYDGTVFTYVPGGVRKVRDMLTAGDARQMNAEEATRYGRQHGRCFSCLSIGRPGKLSDDRSLAVGYGPDCADWHGWFYPSEEQAARILRGES